jgi:tetratricopeptide (TPR) repeat protein
MIRSRFLELPVENLSFQEIQMTSSANQPQAEQLELQIQQALSLAEQGDLMASEALYHQVLQQNPGNPKAIYGLAQLAGAIDYHDVKEVLLGLAVEQLTEQAGLAQKSLAVAWLTERAEVLFKLNRPTDAMDCIKQCENLIGENLDASQKP